MKKLKFSIEEMNVITEISDSQLAILEIFVCHDGMNLHKKPIPLESIKAASSTLHNKFLVAGYDGDDFEGHEPDQRIVGFFPKENQFKFVEKNGKTYLVAQSIMSKVYADWAYGIFVNKENKRAVSMEITVLETDIKADGYEWITSFVFNGVTILGPNVNPACPDSDAMVYKFSEKEDIDKCEEIYSWNFSMPVGEGDYSLTVDKSKDSLSNTGWGGVSKTALMRKVVNAKNNKSLVKSVYMVVESGWEESPSGKLKYPVMQESSGKIVYNKGGLKSAQGYAEAEGLSSVASKIKKIRQKLGLMDKEGKTNAEGKEYSMERLEVINKMSELECMLNYQVIEVKDNSVYFMDKESKELYGTTFATEEDAVTIDMASMKVAELFTAKEESQEEFSTEEEKVEEESDDKSSEEFAEGIESEDEPKGEEFNLDQNIEGAAQVAQGKKEDEDMKQQIKEEKEPDEKQELMQEDESKVEEMEDKKPKEEPEEEKMGCDGEEVKLQEEPKESDKQDEDGKVHMEEMAKVGESLKDMGYSIEDVKALEVFKKDVLEKELKSNVEFACNNVRGDLTDEQLNSWRDKVSIYENFTAWENALKSEAYEFAKEKEPTNEEDIVRYSINTVKPKETNTKWWEK